LSPSRLAEPQPERTKAGGPDPATADARMIGKVSGGAGDAIGGNLRHRLKRFEMAANP
jgi:hypothetical protein